MRVAKLGPSYAVLTRGTYDLLVASGAPLPDHVDIIEPRPGLVCRVYWGTHGCDLERGHDGPHECDCCECPEHGAVIEGGMAVDADGVGCPAKPPYYGPDTDFYGEDV